MNKGLIQIVNEYHSILYSKKRKAVLEQELIIQKKNIPILEEIVEKELDDIVQLENASLKILFSNILKNKEEQLEKERQEYLIAVINLRDCKKLIELIEFELQVLTKKVNQETDVIEKLNTELSKIDIEFADADSSYFLLLKEQNKKIINFTKIRIESWEALQILKLVNTHFIKMIEYLRKAEEFDNWGTFYNEIQQAKIQHQNYIDQAHHLSQTIRRSLKILYKELQDVIDVSQIRKEEYFREKDFGLQFYNNLILDWINDNNLSTTIVSTLNFSYTLKKIDRILINQYNDSIKSIEKIEFLREELIETLRK